MQFRFVKKIPALPVIPGMSQENREAANDLKAHSFRNSEKCAFSFWRKT